MSDGTDQTTELPSPDPRRASPEALTTPLPAAQPPVRASHVALVFCAAAAGSFLLGIALATATRPASDETVVVSEEVGSSGKTIGFEGGEIRIPGGALVETVRIVVRRSAVTDRIRVQTSGDAPVVPPGRLVAYSFEPTDVTFRAPVEITFTLPEGVRNAAVFARRDGSVVVLTGTLDADRGTATAVVRDFRFEGGDT